ncbi:hypothetical protein [Bacillus sp. FSL K6-3200]|uniref:hypothetical protein n=1 Tax=Bacillus sp. FSL K6-3200 TaxID=2921496 RepID=UPI003159D2C9
MDQTDEEFLYPLSWAAASSLPEDEGLHHILEKLKSISEKEWPLEAFICLHRFRSNKILDWMEAIAPIFTISGEGWQPSAAQPGRE